MGITSYAQNFEDVILWRALRHIEHGNYIDIGAQHPTVDSVSLVFHEHGWRGVHVEPSPAYASLLREARPGDQVIEAAVGLGPARVKLFEIAGTGLSTVNQDIAERHGERGFQFHEIEVANIPLSEVFKLCSGIEVHWLKIDTEGAEEAVISSWGSCSIRPWVVLIESTIPLTQTQSYEAWEPRLLSFGYDFAYFDGLNRFYVSAAHPELKKSLGAPPNTFDDFRLSGTGSSPFHQPIDTPVHNDEPRSSLPGRPASVRPEPNSISREIARAVETELSRAKSAFGELVEELRSRLELAEQSYASEASNREQLAEEKAKAEIFREESAQREAALVEKIELLREAQSELTRQLHEQSTRQQEREHEFHRLLVERDRAHAEANLSAAEKLRFLHEAHVRRESELLEQQYAFRLESEAALHEKMSAFEAELTRQAVEQSRNQQSQEREFHRQILECEQMLSEAKLSAAEERRRVQHAQTKREVDLLEMQHKLRLESELRLREVEYERELKEGALAREATYHRQVEDAANNVLALERDWLGREQSFRDEIAKLQTQAGILNRELERRTSEFGIKLEAANSERQHILEMWSVHEARLNDEHARAVSGLNSALDAERRAVQALNATLSRRASNWFGRLVGGWNDNVFAVPLDGERTRAGDDYGALPKVPIDQKTFQLVALRRPRSCSQLQTLLTLGDVAGARGDWLSAVRAYQGALALDPRQDDVWLRLGEALREQGNYVEAKVAFQRAIERDPHASKPRLYLARMNEMVGDGANAWRNYSRSLLLDPTSDDAADGLRRIGAEAPSSLLDRILDGLTKDAAGAEAYGGADQSTAPELKGLRRALDRALKVKRSGGQNVTWPVHRLVRAGNLARDRREWSSAAVLYRRALSKDRALAHIWVQLGNALKESGDYEGAKTAYLQAAWLRPRYSEAALQLGHLLKVTGDLARAKLSYARAVLIDGLATDAADEFHRLVAKDGVPDRDAVAAFLAGKMLNPAVVAALASHPKPAHSEPYHMPNSVYSTTQLQLSERQMILDLKAPARNVLLQLQADVLATTDLENAPERATLDSAPPPQFDPQVRSALLQLTEAVLSFGLKGIS